MKKLLFVLALIVLCGAAFANNVSDPEVTLTGWSYGLSQNSDDDISDLGDGKGFTVTADKTAGRGVAYFTADGYSGGVVSGWLFNENEPITLTILESDVIADDNIDVALEVWNVGSSYVFYTYKKPYNGVGEYVFTAQDIVDVAGTGRSLEGLAVTEAVVYVGDGNNAYLPEGGKFTATFAKVDKPETVVPEPMAAVYGLLGFGSLLGMKRRITK